MNKRKHGKQLVSAGGLVYRAKEEEIEVVICGTRTPQTWRLPKGMLEARERSEEAALREVEEETGLKVTNEGFISSTDYWFNEYNNGKRYHKTVNFFLMSPIGGDVSKHDEEFDYVLWVTVNKALEMLTFENEIDVVKKGLGIVLGGELN